MPPWHIANRRRFQAGGTVAIADDSTSSPSECDICMCRHKSWYSAEAETHWLCVSAGALPSIASSTYRVTASQIGSTEAYHAAALRTQLYLQLNTVPAYGLTVANATNNIVLFENTVAGSPQIKYNIYNTQGNGSAATSNVNANGKLLLHALLLLWELVIWNNADYNSLQPSVKCIMLSKSLLQKVLRVKKARAMKVSLTHLPLQHLEGSPKLSSA